MTPPKRPRPDFGAFQAPEAQAEETLDRSRLRGLSIEETVERVMEHYERLRDLRPVTLKQKALVLRIILKDLEARGVHLATVGERDVLEYRAFLHQLTQTPGEEGGISRNYAAHMVNQWNSVMRAVFGDRSKPGTGLIMRGFKQTPKSVKHLTQEDHDALVAAVPEMHFRSPIYAHALRAYLEVAWCCGARVGSLLSKDTRAENIRWEDNVLVLGHMKNMDTAHEVVLTDRAVRALRTWVGHLERSDAWTGRSTPLFAGPGGKLLTPQWLNRALKRAAALAGVSKPLTSHVFRHTAGTLIGRENPKLATMQLGVTDRVFQRHYNRPMLEDRLARRDVLPGSDGTRQTPMEKLGAAYWKFEHGLLDKAQLEHVLELTRLAERTHKTSNHEDSPSYA